MLEAARRQQELQRRIKQTQAQLQEAKEENKRRGRYPKEKAAKVNALDAELKLLRSGVLPEEAQPPPKVSEAAALEAARASAVVQGRLAYPQLPPAGRPRKPVAATATADTAPAVTPPAAACASTGAVHCDPDASDDDDDSSGNDAAVAGKRYYSISTHQELFITRKLAAAKHSGLASWSSFTARPDAAISGRATGSIAGFCVVPTHFWAPHMFYHNCGFPPHPPCPKHGWSAVEKGMVESHGWVQPCNARRVCGIARDEYLMGTRHRCKLCKSERDQAVEDAFTEGTAAETRTAAVRAAEAAHPYNFRSYDPAVTRWYLARFPWVASELPVLVCTHNTAMTHELGRLLESMCSAAGTSNPTMIANMLAELKALEFDRARLAYYSHQVWNRREQAPRSGASHDQPTVAESWARAGAVPSTQQQQSVPALLTEEEYRLVSPGHGLIRRWFMDFADSKQVFQFIWRQQHISGTVLQVDHHLKVFKGSNVHSVKLGNAKCTIFLSDLNCPMLSINTETTGFRDGALRLACAALLQSERDNGRPPFKLIYCDNPRRDARGITELLLHDTDASSNDAAGSGGSCDAASGDADGDADGSTAGGTARGGGAGGGGGGSTASADIDETQQPLSRQQVAELVGSYSEAAEGGDDMTADAAGDQAPIVEDASAVMPVEICLVLLSRAEAVVREYAAGGSRAPLHLPSALSSADRAALHNLAGRLGLTHRSEGEGDSRQLVIGPPPLPGPTVQAEQPAMQCAADWGTTCVKYDPYHWMANFFLMAHSKESSLFKYFCTSVSEALFQILPGERERVTTHLRILDPAMTDERIRHMPRAYWRRYCRYTIPAPTVLYNRLHAVYTFFSGLHDPAAPTRRPFFNSKHEKIFNNSMVYIMKGNLSDPPNLDMYKCVWTLQTGLVVYRSLRSTSHVEGYHLHVRQVNSITSASSCCFLYLCGVQ